VGGTRKTEYIRGILYKKMWDDKFNLGLREASCNIESTVKPGYNDIGLSDNSYITSHVLWYQLIAHY
jgi:hypothetical protein